MEKMGTTQRINSGPNERFLALTDVYIKAILNRFKRDEPTLKVRIERSQDSVFFIVLNQVYRFTNNGHEATVGFAGFSNQ
jgi:hypothetical protein